MAVYLNTYEVCQAYGGPEEGGWWYDRGTPVQSILLSQGDYETWIEDNSEDSINCLKDGVTKSFTSGKAPTPRKTGYGGYTFAPGSEDPVSYEMDNNFITVVEETFAQPYPKERPHYC